MLKVYYLRVTDFADYSEGFLKVHVSEETRQAVNSFRSEKPKRTRLLGEFMVRSLLQSEWGLKNENYQILRGEHGKPFVSGASVSAFFNLSHSGDYIVCALSEKEVGIDIERVGRFRPEVAGRFFHPGEVRVLENLPEDRQADAFFRYWSAKESFLKYTGTGLSASLSGFEVCFGEQVRIRKGNLYEPVSVRECYLDKDYKCFVCYAEPEVPGIFSFKKLSQTK